MMTISVLFSCILVLELICTAIVIFSLLQPKMRLWPPREKNSASGILMQTLFNLTAAGIILLGILDWNPEWLSGWNRVIGGLFWITGMGLAIRGVACLGIKNTTGSSSGLVIKGPYRWTRNPQYLGFMLGLIGWGLMSDSSYTLIAGIAGWIPLYLVPCIEEPWLVDKYGAEYADYLKTIPRFLFLL